ncbi:MAG TPA: ABC transporter substrate-binding protein [Longimicrobiales bacterium]
MMRALALAGFGLLIGCGDTDRPGDRAGGSGGEYNTLGGGPPGGMLVVMADREPDQLNPLTFNSTPAYHAVHLMFRALAARDSTLSNYAPDLATSWQLQDDSTLVIKLRDDVYWHDGRHVTAEDVVFTIQRQRDPSTGSPRRGDVAAVTAVVARDSFTVEVKLERGGLYTVNALLEVVPVPRHLLANVAPAEMTNAPFSRSPVGNGFYRFGEWRPGQQLTLFADTAKPDGRAAIDRIVMRFIPDVNAAMTELLTGSGDLVSKLPPSQLQRARASANVKVYNGPRVRPAWIAWNTRRAPLDDVRVRRALLMAIDRETLAKGMFAGVGEAAYSPIPKSLREHSPDVKPIAYDPAGARALLEQAGWRDRNRDGILERDGRPLRIEVEFISSDQTRQDVLVAMQSMLRQVGVDIVPRAFESSTWVQHLRDGSFAGSFWGWGWGPGVVGPNAEMIFHSRSIPPKGPNFAAARNPRVDQLIDSVLVIADTTRARGVWRELEQLLIDDAVYAPVYLDPELFAVHARFRNVRFRGIEWVEDVPYWYVDPQQRLPRDRSR